MSEQEQPSMDINNFYREDSFTDRVVGTIRRLTPVTPEGEDDTARDTIYIGSAQMMTPAGAIPLNFEIDAKGLAEAAEKFNDHAQVAMEETIRELQEMRRDQASSIVVPGQESGGGIQLP